MGFIWSSTLKDLRRRARDPLALVLWLGIPFAILAMIVLAFGGRWNSVKPQAHLLVVDEDDSFLSQLLIGSFGRGPMEELVRVEEIGREEGMERIGKGDGSALLIIPDGFAGDVLNERPVTLTLLTNPAQRILPGIVEETLSIMVDGTFYVQRVLGEPLREIAEGPPEGANTFLDETISSFSVTVNQLIDRVADYLFPPAISLETTVEAEEHEDLNFSALFFQGMFFMALMFMAQGLSDDVWTEREQGTLRRVVVAPQFITAFLAGKLLSGALLFAAVGLIVLAVGCLLFGFGFEHLPLAVVWSMFSGVLLTSLFMLIQLLATSYRAAGILANLVLFPFILVGGNFFPLELMPDFLANIGRWTPNGWALEQLKAILAGAADVAPLGAAFAALATVTALAFLISARRFSGGFAQS